MRFNSPLSQRIVISIVLLTTVVSGIFAAGIIFTIDFVEKNLVTIEMELLFPKVLADYRNNIPLNLDKSTQFYMEDQNLPYYLRDVNIGFTEIVLDNQAFYAYRHDSGQSKYYLVRDQTDFEDWEDRLEFVAIGGFFVSVAASFCLGLLMVKMIIAPVRRLTSLVRDSEKLINSTPHLASDYPDDEVGSLAKAFDDTIGMLNQALQREVFFTSDVSHELRTPLMVVKSSCDILIAKKDMDAFTLMRIGMIAKATDEMQTLVDSCLALARLQETPAKMASLQQIVEDKLDVWVELAREKQFNFVLRDESNADSREHRYPEVLLRTVLNNLIRNAIQHAGQGDVTLVLTAKGFEVHDTGPGIAANDRERVFLPYFQGESPHPESLGLGLSLVHRICEKMHWRISLEDNQPQGCRFLVVLQ